MTFGQNENARGAMGFELVKSVIDDCKITPFSDSPHNILKVVDF